MEELQGSRPFRIRSLDENVGALRDNPALLLAGFVSTSGSTVQLSRLEISPKLPVEVSRWIDQVTEFATKTLLHGERSQPGYLTSRLDRSTALVSSECVTGDPEVLPETEQTSP